MPVVINIPHDITKVNRYEHNIYGGTMSSIVSGSTTSGTITFTGVISPGATAKLQYQIDTSPLLFNAKCVWVSLVGFSSGQAIITDYFNDGNNLVIYITNFHPTNSITDVIIKFMDMGGN